MWSYLKVLAWGFAWYPVWLITLPFKQNRDNCLTYALKKWDKEGGYLVIRWSRSNRFRYVRWPHFLWLDYRWHTRLEHIIPEQEFKGQKHTLPKPWFTPRVVHGDPENGIHSEN